MRKMFPGYFRPSEEEFKELWENCIFVVDTNILLHLYRYSPDTREAIIKTLNSLSGRLFLPQQIAKEFLKNRLGVMAKQVEECKKVIDTLEAAQSTLSDKKKQPFIDSEYLSLIPRVVESLKLEHAKLENRITSDEVIDFIEYLFCGKVGKAFDDNDLKKIQTEGESRYKNDIPPGYLDGKKDSSGDINRKFGDLIFWKQIIDYSKENEKSIVLAIDDQKEDWWLKQSGKTISPRPELIEEFIKETSQKFWMYSFDRFMEETAKIAKVNVDQKVIDEIKEVSIDSRASVLFQELKELVASGSKQPTLKELDSSYHETMHPLQEHILKMFINLIGKEFVIDAAAEDLISEISHIISEIHLSDDGRHPKNPKLHRSTLQFLNSNILGIDDVLTTMGVKIIKDIAIRMSRV